MRIQMLLSGLVTIALAAPLSGETRVHQFESIIQSGPRDPDLQSPAQAENVQFADDEYDRMTVPVRLAGTGPYRFLVDTGADRTAVSRSLVNRLALKPAGTANLHSVTGVTPVEMALVPSLQLASREIRVQGAPILSQTNMGADGILGVDSLRSQRIQFDFRAGTMTIVPSVERDVIEEDGAIVVRAKERNGRLILTRAMAEDRSVSVVLDTGSEISVGNDELRRRLIRSERKALERLGKVLLHSVTGETLIGDYMILRSFHIGGVTLKDLPIVFVEAHTFRQLKLDDRPAMLLGMNAMRAFDKVSIDFTSKKLHLLPPEKFRLDRSRPLLRVES